MAVTSFNLCPIINDAHIRQWGISAREKQQSATKQHSLRLTPTLPIVRSVHQLKIPLFRWYNSVFIWFWVWAYFKIFWALSIISVVCSTPKIVCLILTLSLSHSHSYYCSIDIMNIVNIDNDCVVLRSLSLPSHSVSFGKHPYAWHPLDGSIPDQGISHLGPHCTTHWPPDGAATDSHRHCLSFFGTILAASPLATDSHLPNPNKVYNTLPSLLSAWVLIIDIFLVDDPQGEVSRLSPFDSELSHWLVGNGDIAN